MKAYGDRQPSVPASDKRDLRVASLTQLGRPRMA